MEKIALKSQKVVLAIFMIIFTFISFAPTSNCFGYVTTDWDAIARANKRQEVKTKSQIVNGCQSKIPLNYPTSYTSVDAVKDIKIILVYGVIKIKVNVRINLKN